jgi:hypothetical protein
VSAAGKYPTRGIGGKCSRKMNMTATINTDFDPKLKERQLDKACHVLQSSGMHRRGRD